MFSQINLNSVVPSWN